MAYEIRKQTYSDGRAYRYEVTDTLGDLLYIAERVGIDRPRSSQQVRFLGQDEAVTATLEAAEVAPWQRARHYELLSEEGETLAAIEEKWRLVDILLLRLPRYGIQVGEQSYLGVGTRYGEPFYKLYRTEAAQEETNEEEPKESEIDEEKLARRTEKILSGEEDPEEPVTQEEEPPPGPLVGSIIRPTAGPSYLIETEWPPLEQASLALAALVVLIDIETFS